MKFKNAEVPPDFLVSRQNIFHSAQDLPFGMWGMYYQEMAQWISRINWCFAIKDIFSAYDYSMILFGMVQPGLQTKKIKWKDKDGVEHEQFKIEWYRTKVGELDKLMSDIEPYIIRSPGMSPSWRYSKNDRMDELPKKVSRLMIEVRTFVWQLNFDMASIGLTFPRGENPATSLMRSQ